MYSWGSGFSIEEVYFRQLKVRVDECRQFLPLQHFRIVLTWVLHQYPWQDLVWCIEVMEFTVLTVFLFLSAHRDATVGFIYPDDYMFYS